MSDTFAFAEAAGHRLTVWAFLPLQRQEVEPLARQCGTTEQRHVLACVSLQSLLTVNIHSSRPLVHAHLSSANGLA